MAKSDRKPATHSKAQHSGLHALSVCGFKSIATEQRIEFKPLTVLAGANSAGKSSMLQTLLLLKQTLEAPHDPGPLRLDGANVRFTSADQMLCCNSPIENGFSIGFETHDGVDLKLTFVRGERGQGMQIKAMDYCRKDYGTDAMTIRPNMDSKALERALDHAIPEETRRLKEIFADREPGLIWKVIPNRCFLEFGLGSPAGPGFWAAIPLLAYSIGNPIATMIHVPGLRGNPNRAYPATAVGDTFPGTFENYTASVVNHWSATKDHNLKELGKDLERLGLTWKVAAKPIDDTQVELQVGRLPHAVRGGGKDMVNLADVGFGVSQTLPVLVALRVARPGQLVYLEQPEIHLHPRAQEQLAGILADAAKRGVVVVVETHSALLLRGIQTLVAKSGELDPSLVKLHWFSRDPSSGATVVTTAELDQYGAYGDWPEDFDTVALEAEQAYLDAVVAAHGMHP